MVYVRNDKAHFDYDLLEKFEAGLQLLGLEVKSLKLGRAQLQGSHVIIRGGEAFWVGGMIHPYQPANTPADYDPSRTRKLLLNKKEIAHLQVKSQAEGLTIIPLSVYNKERAIKFEIALARGRKKFDKRQVLKKRVAERDMDRALKGRRDF